MSTRYPAALRAALLVAALGSGGARATTVELPSFDELVRRSEVIARVRVIEQRVERPVAGAAAGRARTWTTLVVTDALAGAVVAERLVLFQPGDASTNAAGVVGQPVHRVGDDVVLFLARVRVHGRDAVIHRGLGYGIYDVGVDGVLVERAADVARVPSSAGSLPARLPSLTALHDAVRKARMVRTP
ncbi:MAG: hypothetical protein A2138_00735 [Deltaproteobacteria bacterium RBG_16_71_12]|nr:MAG: hypothetical protein A2138_00735 [Deltaproteobacteria bacterium RBG_16_71_12]